MYQRPSIVHNTMEPEILTKNFKKFFATKIWISTNLKVAEQREADQQALATGQAIVYSDLQSAQNLNTWPTA